MNYLSTAMEYKPGKEPGNLPPYGTEIYLNPARG